MIHLPKSYKKQFPFMVGSPSYIYPDHLIPNVRLLGPFIDEIEILLFESKPESLPSPSDIRTLADLSHEYDLSYNVHLPVDVSLTDPDKVQRSRALEILLKTIELTAPLNPSTWTIHLPCESDLKSDSINIWKDRAYQSIDVLGTHGIPLPKISIETLNYPFSYTDDILKDFNVSICMDIGHLVCHGYDTAAFFNRYRSRISIIHLSGVDNGKDHLALNRMPEPLMTSVCRILNEFHQIVSLEVFSYDHLKDSLKCLEQQLAS